MKLKNTLNLLFSNLRTVSYDLIFRAICSVLLICVATVFTLPLFREVVSVAEAMNIFTSFKDLLLSVFDGKDSLVEATGALKQNLDMFLQAFADDKSQIIWVCVVLGIITVLFAFVNGMANYASCVAIDGHMSSLTKIGYFKALIANFSRAFWCQFISAVIEIIWTGSVFVLCVMVFYFTAGSIYLLAFPVSVIIFILATALSGTFLSNFMPAVINGQKVGKAFAQSFVFAFKGFGDLYIQYACYTLVVLYLNISVAAFTFGAGLIFTLPASCVLCSCLRLVNYYSANKKKYYIDYDNIVVPAELRTEDEKFLTGLDI